MPTAIELGQEHRDPKLKEARLARLEELENQVFERAHGILEAVLSFHEVEPNQTEPPADWIQRYGEEGAKQRLQVAKSGWLPQSIAPNATKLAAFVQAGILRARRFNAGKLTQNNINVKIALPPPTTAEHPGEVVYEVRDLE